MVPKQYRDIFNMGINAVLINPYELGRQSFGLAHPAARLRTRGHTVHCIDLSVQRLSDAPLAAAQLIGIQLAMHTATRIAGEALPKIRAMAPQAHIVAYGLYAPVNESWLREQGVNSVLGGEFETELEALATALEQGQEPAAPARAPVSFIIPDRSGLTPLAQHARLRLAGGGEVTMGFAETTRGCKHLCRHCPVVPVYQGRFIPIPVEVVMSDIRAQVAAGAEHISFGDPDFFNGPGHAQRVLRAMHAEFPGLTFDAVIKVEHLLKYRKRLPLLKETGCRFIISAVESVDDTILAHLAKNHTRDDFFAITRLLNELRIGFAPTFVAFTPWTTLEGYLQLLRDLVTLSLVESVPPIQLAIRLLIPNRSHLFNIKGFSDLVKAFDPTMLGYPWVHRDGRVDELQAQLQTTVEQAYTSGLTRAQTFTRIWQIAHDAAGHPAPPLHERYLGAPIAHHTENWYCCAEPTAQQLSGF